VFTGHDSYWDSINTLHRVLQGLNLSCRLCVGEWCITKPVHHLVSLSVTFPRHIHLFWFDLDALRQRTETRSRLREDAATTGETENDEDVFKQTLIEALAERQQAGSQRTVSFWDGELAGSLDALDSHPEWLRTVGVALQEALGRDPDPEVIDWSEVVRLATRLGIQEVDPDLVETCREAVADAARQL
jgi:hypothetical protein